MSETGDEARDALLKKIRFVCDAARALVAVLLVMNLIPIVTVTSFLLLPMEGATVSASSGWGLVASSLAKAVIVIAAAYVGQRAPGRIGRTCDFFRLENARDLGLVARIVLAGSVVSGCAGVLAAIVRQAGFSGSLVDPATLVAGLLLLAVAKVFEYACALRQDA